MNESERDALDARLVAAIRAAATAHGIIVAWQDIRSMTQD